MGTPPTLRQTPIVATKLRPPSNSAALVERPRLRTLLAQVLTRKLALIHAPAGFGKTTLAAQWRDTLLAQGVTASWLTVDAGDNDVARFLAYLVEAIRAVEPDIGSGLSALIESRVHGATEFVLAELVNEFQLHDKEFVFFLDDWHAIVHPDIHKAVDFLLSSAPPNFHLVITSRSRENLPLARLRVQDALVEIDSAGLRFNQAESASFLEEAKALKLQAGDVRLLWRSTEGWAAALQLASISLRRTGERERLLAWASGTPSDVGDYLTENVLSALPQRLTDFMLKSSILGRLSADLCRAVTGERDSEDFLDQLERQELFLLPLDEERRWFRYHQLFAKFLQRRLERERPTEIPLLHSAAARWFSAAGQTADALAHALAAGEPRLAADIVEKDAPGLVQNSYMATALGLVAQLPKSELAQRPRLLLAVAWAQCLTHHPFEAEQALSSAMRAGRGMSTDVRKLLAGEADVIRGCSDVYADRIDDVEKLVRACLDNRAKYPPWVVGVATNLLTYQYLNTNDHQLVPPLQAWAREYQDRAEGLFSGIYGRCFSGIAAQAGGDLALAKRHFRDAVQSARASTGRQSHAARLACALLGQLQYEMNELQEAAELLQESSTVGIEGGVADTYMATYIAGARLCLLKGNRAAASDILLEGGRTARHLGLDRLAASVAAEQVRISLGEGDLAAAQEALSAFDPVLREGEPLHAGVQAQTWEILQQAQARLLLDQGRGEEALSILRVLLRRTQQSGRVYLAVQASATLAVALDACGHKAEAEEAMMVAVTQGGKCGMVRSILDEGPRAVRLLQRFRDSRAVGAGRPRIDQLLAAAPEADPGAGAKAGAQQGGGRAADALTRREIEILGYVEEARSNKEIARTMDISVDTVKWYLKAIFGKLGVTRRGQAVAQARRLRMLQAPEGKVVSENHS